MSVLVYIETSEGKVKKQSAEAATYGALLAQKMGSDSIGLVLGSIENSVCEALGKHGLTKVVKVGEDRLNNLSAKAYAKAIASAAGNQSSNVVVMANTTTGKAIAGRVAARMQAGLVSGAIELPKETGDKFVVRKGAFSGKAFADYAILTSNKVISVSPNSIPVSEDGSNCAVEETQVDFTDADFPITVVERKMQSGDISLPEAERVVSGGRGLRGPENWGMIEELANLLNAATACSRAVADVDWRPHHEHVGQTGLAITPNLYIAIAISGAIQHLAGVNQSKTIVVINNDPEAPFFKAADYGVCADAFDVVPKLISEIKALKGIA